MTQGQGRLLAQEGSIEGPVSYGATEYLLLGALVVVCLMALTVAYILARQVLRAGTGTSKMQEIAAAVQEGSRAYLTRQFRTIALFAALLFVLLLFLPADSITIRIGRSIAFLFGALFSGATGYIGMSLAVRANVRVAAAADQGLRASMPIAFRSGGVAGMFTVGLGLLGVTIIIMLF